MPSNSSTTPMEVLQIINGPQLGRTFALQPDKTILGRAADAHICLESVAVSRQHAQITNEQGNFYVEDLGSINGTFLNGLQVLVREPLQRGDELQLGPYLFSFRAPPAAASDAGLLVREQVSVLTTNQILYDANPREKLRVVLEIAQHLANTLNPDELLGKLLEHLLSLFPQADRGLVLRCEGDRLVLRAERCRRPGYTATHLYSRTIVHRALEEGVGLLSQDVHTDARFKKSDTLTKLHLRSLLCVPIITKAKQRLGVIQLECAMAGSTFCGEDLQLLSILALQVAVVLENTNLHERVMREESWRRELELAREIQQGFLPTKFPQPKGGEYELYASVHPARQVSGDLYDFLTLEDGRLAFFVGDITGKGIPAAMLMVAVRTLGRHLSTRGELSPAETLTQLNLALAADNTSDMFVTLIHGIFEPITGEVVLASGGHPPPLLRRVTGEVGTVPITCGRLLGYPGIDPDLCNTSFQLQPGETLILYTDGYVEAKDPKSKQIFDLARLQEVLGGESTRLSLKECAAVARTMVQRFIKSKEQQDDLTLLLLRRLAGTQAKV